MLRKIRGMKSETNIAELSFDFALQSISLYKILIDSKEYILSKQFLRSACSIGANVEEAGAGQTKKDFIAKMAIASKEARETKYWLRLLDRSRIVKADYAGLLITVESIIRILTKIVKTAQENT